MKKFLSSLQIFFLFAYHGRVSILFSIIQEMMEEHNQGFN